MSAQSSQIRDLCSKLDSAIVKNSQMWEFLNPSMLQTMVTNVLQAIQSGNHSHGNNNSGSRTRQAFLGQDPKNLSCQLGRMGPLTLRRLVIIARIQGMIWITACIYNARKTF